MNLIPLGGIVKAVNLTFLLPKLNSIFLESLPVEGVIVTLIDLMFLLLELEGLIEGLIYSLNLIRFISGLVGGVEVNKGE